MSAGRDDSYHAKGTLSANAERPPKHGLEGYCGGVVAGEDQNLVKVFDSRLHARQGDTGPSMNGSWSVSLRFFPVEYSNPMSQENVELARRNIDAWNRGDVDT